MLFALSMEGTTEHTIHQQLGSRTICGRDLQHEHGTETMCATYKTASYGCRSE